jgi:hypothetical protein
MLRAEANHLGQALANVQKRIEEIEAATTEG